LTKPLLALAAIVSLALMSSCSVTSNNNGDVDGHVTKDKYDPAQCTSLLPSTGDTAIYSKIKVSNPVTSAYFEKRYNRALLEGVLGASGAETQAYAEAAGIQTFKIPVQAAKDSRHKVCLFQHSLSEAPEAFRTVWDKEAGGEHGGGHLDGLFIAYTDGVHAEAQEAIMVREDSTRWTLVHEMMHANFFRQRRLDGVSGDGELQDEVKSKLSILTSEFAQYKTAPTSDGLTLITSDSNEVARLLYSSLVSGSLEEIADESLLLEEWSAGRLKNVSDSSAKNAAWYINYARTLSLADLNSFQQNVIDMRSYIVAHPPAAPTDGTGPEDSYPEFQKTLDFIASVNQTTADLAQKARDQTASLGQVNSMILSSALSGFSNVGRSTNFSEGTSEMPEADLRAMNNTPAMIEFRKQNAKLSAQLAHSN
jgi:hypothetical protein